MLFLTSRRVSLADPCGPERWAGPPKASASGARGGSATSARGIPASTAEHRPQLEFNRASAAAGKPGPRPPKHRFRVGPRSRSTPPSQPMPLTGTPRAPTLLQWRAQQSPTRGFLQASESRGAAARRPAHGSGRGETGSRCRSQRRASRIRFLGPASKLNAPVE